MTEQLELVLLVAFVVSVTGLLITGMVRLALRLAARSARRQTGTERLGLRRTARTTPRAAGAA